jgi:hypothetical protein
MDMSSQPQALAILSQGKTALCPLNRNMGKPKSQCGHFGREKISCPCQYFNPDHPSHSLDTTRHYID